MKTNQKNITIMTETLIKAWLVGLGIVLTVFLGVVFIVSIVLAVKFLSNSSTAIILVVTFLIPCVIGLLANGTAKVFYKKGKK